jgi:hypothetical protein
METVGGLKRTNNFGEREEITVKGRVLCHLKS